VFSAALTDILGTEPRAVQLYSSAYDERRQHAVAPRGDTKSPRVYSSAPTGVHAESIPFLLSKVQQTSESRSMLHRCTERNARPTRRRNNKQASKHTYIESNGSAPILTHRLPRRRPVIRGGRGRWGDGGGREDLGDDDRTGHGHQQTEDKTGMAAAPAAIGSQKNARRVNRTTLRTTAVGGKHGITLYCV